MKRFVLFFTFILAGVAVSYAQGTAALASQDSLGVGSSMARFFQSEDFEIMREQAVSDAMSYEGYARLIAGLGALIFICSVMWRSWANAQPIDFYAMLRPIAIFLLIVFFPVVPELIEVFAAPFTSVTQQIKDNKEREYDEAFAEYHKLLSEKIQAKEQADKENEGSGFLDWIEKIYLLLQSVFLARDELFNQLGIRILEMLAYAVVLCLHVFTVISKIVLIIVGPIVFALSLFPYFKDSLKTWFFRYVNLCLYIPLINIIGYCNQSIYLNIFYGHMIRALQNGNDTVALNMSGLYSILFLFVGVIMYCMVPKLAGWILDGQGNGLIGSAVGSAARVAGMSMAGSAGAGLAKTLVK